MPDIKGDSEINGGIEIYSRESLDSEERLDDQLQNISDMPTTINGTPNLNLSVIDPMIDYT